MSDESIPLSHAERVQMAQDFFEVSAKQILREMMPNPSPVQVLVMEKAMIRLHNLMRARVRNQ